MLTEEQILNAKILIIDEKEGHVSLLMEILQRAGYRNITFTYNPVRAIELYRQIKPDLVFLDIEMSHLNGFEIMKELKGTEGDNYLPVAIISDNVDQALRHKALESGAKDFLNKPFLPATLLTPRGPIFWMRVRLRTFAVFLLVFGLIYMLV